jgi:C-terminal processing protease CtpA/Prc
LADTRPAIRVALAQLGDGHSSYRALDGTFIFVGLRNCTASGALAPSNLPADIGYVRVGSFAGTPEQATTFASGIQATIRNADRDSLIGWIVDLRGNGGGNMWPMIAGLGPVVGTGTLGAFIDPDGQEILWGYRDGASWLGSRDLQRVPSPYTLRRPNPRVAVLVDNGVASSGEATFLAFRRRPDTRSFGAPTCGLSTANSGYPLSDGALLNLTVSVMADREKGLAGDQIAPDERVTGTTAVVDRAVEWLRTGRP